MLFAFLPSWDIVMLRRGFLEDRFLVQFASLGQKPVEEVAAVEYFC